MKFLQLALATFVAVDACGSAQTSSSSPSPTAATESPQHAAVVAPDRSPEDRALDAGRHPEEMLVFFGIAPGMRVAEIEAGRGYTTELMARVVGPKGKIYAQNNPLILEKFANKPFTDRLAKPVNRDIVVRADRELEDPLPPDARELDVVVNILFYHDTVWMKTDRAKMNAAIFASLKQGGVYGVIDHSARAGSGMADVQTLHRIEESVVREEILRAGFKLVGEASFLRNSQDTRDWSASPGTAGERRGTSDRFVLKFVKP